MNCGLLALDSNQSLCEAGDADAILLPLYIFGNNSSFKSEYREASINYPEAVLKFNKADGVEVFVLNWISFCDSTANAVIPKTKWLVAAQRRRSAAAAVTSLREGGASNSTGGDFDQALARGVPGAAGIRFRVNQPAFQYISSLLGGQIGTQIRQARIPSISQCIPKVQGCLNVYNINIEKFNCPQQISLHPAPPNRLALSVQNFDIGVSGNLGGQITVVEPIAIFGIVHFSAQRVTLTVELAVEQGADGSPFVRVVDCRAAIGFADMYIENGGLLGDLANSILRGRIAKQVRNLIPPRVCAELPNIVNEQINSRLFRDLPTSISIEDLTKAAGGAFAALNRTAARGTRSKSFAPVVSTGLRDSATRKRTARVTKFYAPKRRVQWQRRAIRSVSDETEIVEDVLTRLTRAASNYDSDSAKKVAVINSTAEVEEAETMTEDEKVESVVTKTNETTASTVLAKDEEAEIEETTTASAKNDSSAETELALSTSDDDSDTEKMENSTIASHTDSSTSETTDETASTTEISVSIEKSSKKGAKKAADANATKTAIDPVKEILKMIDIRKLANQRLSLNVLRTLATNTDFSVDLSGEVSEGGRRGMTPFGPFPMQFPPASGNRMAELLISDFTVNSLLYQMHKKDFFSFIVGPETPAIGQLLRTTCSDDEEEFDDTSVQIDEEPSLRFRARGARRQRRQRRQVTNAQSLSELGICAGDILPAIREKYPNRNLSIGFKTLKAPSVQLSARNGGLAVLKLDAEASIFVVGETPRKSVGTISIQSTVELKPKISGLHVSAEAKITELKLKDKSGDLGLPQDALDNLSNLSKEMLQKVANDVLGKGITISLPATGLPIQFRLPKLQVVEHAIHVAVDLSLPPGTLGAGGGC